MSAKLHDSLVEEFRTKASFLLTMKNTIYYMTAELPHLRFKVNFADLSKLQTKGFKVGGSGYAVLNAEDEATIFLQDIEKTVKDVKLSAWVAHEIVHVLQMICERHSMEFINEQEHMAYIMHYLMDKLINHEPKKYDKR